MSAKKSSFILLLIILITSICGIAEAKSVYAITNHHASTLKAYEVQGDQLEYQADVNVTDYGLGAVDVTIDLNLSLLFITYEAYEWPPTIVWANAISLEQEGFVTVPGGLAGIVADEAKQRVYAVARAGNTLYICEWDANEEELVLIDSVTLTDLGGQGARGIALDRSTRRLYVANNTATVHYYDADDLNWAHLGTRDVGRAVADITVDSQQACLYTGALYRGAGEGHNYLVKHNLKCESNCNTETDIGTVPIGVAVDADSGLVYCTTSDYQIRVYDCSGPNCVCTYSESTGGSSGPAGICVERSTTLEKFDDVNDGNCVGHGDEIIYTICYSYPNEPNLPDINDVRIVDFLPTEVDFNSASDGGVYNSNAHTIRWDIGTLSPGEANCVTVIVKVNKLAEPETITNYCEMKSSSTYNSTYTNTPVCCPAIAWNPIPSDGATGVDPNADLSWSPGYYADSHDVYFGTTSPQPFIKNQTEMIYDPGTMTLGTTYYWRIDEVNGPNTWKGNVWHFTTVNYLVVDDFESYTGTYCPTPPNPNYLLCVWDPKIGSEYTYAYLGQSPDDPVHGGTKSMEFYYYTKVWPYYSAVRRTYTTAQDWTSGGVKALTLWFRGEAANDAEQMYVELEDAASNSAQVTCDPNLKNEEWMEWNIDLQAFVTANDVNLASIKKLTIGFGDGVEPGVGSSFVCFDDIRLYLPRCLYPPAGDITGDCVVDYRDLKIMAGEWLNSGEADLNEDGVVDFKDYAVLAESWLEGPILWP